MARYASHEEIIPLKDGTTLESYLNRSDSGMVNENYTHLDEDGHSLGFFPQTHLGKPPELLALLKSKVTEETAGLTSLFKL